MSRAATALFIVIVSTMIAAVAEAACLPPTGFVDVPHPAVAPIEQLVAHVEERDINAPLSVVMAANEKPLADTVRKTESLPGPSGVYLLTKGDFGPPGTRRMVCLSDGSTLEEQSLEREQSADWFHFRYVVWNYTTLKARPIEYGVGDFHYYTIDGGHTHVTWTYAFALNRSRFPGDLGSFGDFLFRVGFLDRQYAELMRATIDGIKSSAEDAQKTASASQH